MQIPPFFFIPRPHHLPHTNQYFFCGKDCYIRVVEHLHSMYNSLEEYGGRRFPTIRPIHRTVKACPVSSSIGLVDQLPSVRLP